MLQYIVKVLKNEMSGSGDLEKSISNLNEIIRKARLKSAEKQFKGNTPREILDAINNDYRVNLKAELEIRQLHEKVDHILLSQWKRLMEIQQIQIEVLNELKRK